MWAIDSADTEPTFPKLPEAARVVRLRIAVLPGIQPREFARASHPYHSGRVATSG